MSLSASVLVRRDGFTLDVDVEVASGEVVALVGPNGSGKSTLLSAVAGLITLDGGRVQVNGCLLSAADAPSRTHVEVAHRRVGLVGQDPSLFPHLSAEENVAFGLRARGGSRAAARRAARGWLDDVGLAGLERRRPMRLSGGERQRVAVARALAVEPRALLLDEPLAALDAETAPRIRQLLGDVLERTRVTTMIVTHDPVDALMLADRVVVLDRGRAVAAGPTAELFDRPPTSFVASLVGANYVAVGGVGATDRGEQGGAAALSSSDAASGADAVTFSPHDVAVLPQLSAERPASPERVEWAARIAALEHGLGGVVVRLVDDPVFGVLTPMEVAQLGLRPGDLVTVSVPRRAVRAV